MRQGEVVQCGLEDGELVRECVGVRGAELLAMSRILVGGDGGVGEGAESYATAIRGHTLFFSHRVVFV